MHLHKRVTELLVMMLMALVIYAYLLKEIGQLEKSLELVTQIRLYPQNYYIRITEDKANMLYEFLTTELDGETVRRAEEAGRTMILDDVIDAIVTG